MRTHQAPALEQLQADLIGLMNHYSGQPCDVTAQAIARVLEVILKHPLIDVFPEFRAQCARGLRQWHLRATAAHSGNASGPTCTIH